MIKIVLTGQPIAAGRPRFRNVHKRDGGSFVSAYTPAHMRKWQTDLRYRAQEEMHGEPPLSGSLAVEVNVYLPVPKSLSAKKAQLALDGRMRPITRPDLDNYIKQIDALNGVCWLDDSQIVTLSATKWYSDRPRVEITIQEASIQPARPQSAGLFDAQGER